MIRSFLRYLGIWLSDDWLYSPAEPLSNPQWKSLSIGQSISSDSEFLWFRPRGIFVRKGWYLFTIRQCGENHRAVGWIQSGLHGFSQGRPMYPVRKRFRILRINRDRPLVLKLERVSRPLKIEALRLIRVPFFDAYNRIQLRLKKSNYDHHKSVRLAWKRYNKLLNSQAKGNACVSYSTWQNHVESKLLSDVSNIPFSDKQKFVCQSPSALFPVKPNQWVVLLRPECELTSWALAAVSEQLRYFSDKNMPMIIYGDEDDLDNNGNRYNPRFKPAWNRELFWVDPLYSNHWFVNGKFWNHIFNGIQNIDWWTLQYTLLFYAESCSKHKSIYHFPMILAHSIKPCLRPETASLLQEVLKSKLKNDAPEVCQTSHGHLLHWATPKSLLLSVIIPTKDHLMLLKACLSSLHEYKPGCDVEYIIIDNGSSHEETISFLEEFDLSPNHKVLRDDGPFNYSDLNNKAVEDARGSVLLLLNNDVEMLCNDWGNILASNAIRPGIGCVGAQLHYPDGTIQHSGVILGIGGVASHAHRDLHHDSPGYQRRLQYTQEFSAVTAACLAISTQNWQKLGGFDSKKLAVNYNDVDLCLRATEIGLRNLYLPHVKAIHHESKSRGRPKGVAFRQWRHEFSFMQAKWKSHLENDPAYSPYLTLEDETWNLSLRKVIPHLR